jgi:ribosomal protein S18 acetylase RimI-like enzyme
MARRCGIGSMLLSIVEKHTQHPKGKGKAVELELHVHEANEEARTFYMKQGFIETGKIASGMVIMRRKRDVPS